MIPDSPFSPAFSRQSFLETGGAAEVLRRLEAGLGAREPFLLLTGEPGTGKTALVHEAIARWEGRVAAAFLAYPALTGAELLEEIVRRFGGEAPDGASRPKLVACLEGALARLAGEGKVAMVVVDDAQKLSAELLEELRLLAGAAQQAGRPLEVLLAGLPALEALLDDPALDALRQRVAVRARLEPLPAGETRRYLRHRVDAAGGDGAALFPRKSCNEIVGLTLGVPRKVNALAAEALRVARAAGEQAVTPEHVRAAAASLWGASASRAVPVRDDEAEAPAIAPAAGPAAPARPPSATRDASPIAPPRRDASPVAPPPRAAAPVAAPARAVAPAAMPLDDADVAPKPAPTHHDPNEWVARFIGDKGPIQIGSQAGGHFAPLRERFEPAGEGGAAPAGEAPPSGGPKARSRAVPLPSARPRRRHGGALRVATYATLAACAVLAAFVLLPRLRGAAPASPAPTAVASADSQAAPVRAKGATRRAARTAAAAPTVAVVRPAAARDASSPPPAAGAALSATAEKPVSPTGRWTVEVASAPDLQSAFDERDRLEELVGIEGWVVPAPEGSSAPHRVVLGVYRAYERANATARMLLTSKTLRRADVVPLPRRSERR